MELVDSALCLSLFARWLRKELILRNSAGSSPAAPTKSTEKPRQPGLFCFWNPANFKLRHYREVRFFVHHLGVRSKSLIRKKCRPGRGRSPRRGLLVAGHATTADPSIRCAAVRDDRSLMHQRLSDILNKRHCCRSASIGSSFAALLAG